MDKQRHRTLERILCKEHGRRQDTEDNDDKLPQQGTLSRSEYKDSGIRKQCVRNIVDQQDWSN